MWRAEPSGKWIRKLIPRVSTKHMELVERPNFYLSQAVTGHGAFSFYLCKINKRTTAACPCGKPSQDSEHVFMHCRRYAAGHPTNWDLGLQSGALRQYLIQTMRTLWDEEKEEERTGLNSVRHRSHRPNQRNRAGSTNTVTGSE